MKQIIIAQRGWVFVGDVSRTADEVTIANASCIRRWGTSKGLGEIALHGPTARTTLDAVGTVRLHPLVVVASIDCDEAKWTAL